MSPWLWVVAVARWPCPRAVFLLQTALAAEVWAVVGRCRLTR